MPAAPVRFGRWGAGTQFQYRKISAAALSILPLNRETGSSSGFYGTCVLTCRSLLQIVTIGRNCPIRTLAIGVAMTKGEHHENFDFVAGCQLGLG